MKLINNEKGITLVEIIAALALVTVVSVLIMTTLSIGIQHSVVEGEKTRIQQDANLIISKLLNIHQKGDCYKLEITSEKDLVVLTYKDSTPQLCGHEYTKSGPINSQSYDISAMNTSLVFEKINPHRQNHQISLVLTLKSRSSITYEIITTLSRYKTN